MSLSMAQLEAVEQAALKLAREKAEKKRKLMATPPRTSNDIEELASMQGLDISGLMKEIKRR